MPKARKPTNRSAKVARRQNRRERVKRRPSRPFKKKPAKKPRPWPSRRKSLAVKSPLRKVRFPGLRKRLAAAAIFGAVAYGASGCPRLGIAPGGKRPARALERPSGKMSSRVSQTQAAKPPPAQFTVPASGQWAQIFKAFPGWQRGMSMPRHKKNAEAAVALVERVAASTGTSPANVIDVRRKYAISQYALPRYQNISETELNIFKELLREKNSNKQAFDYMVRATRSWFSNN